MHERLLRNAGAAIRIIAARRTTRVASATFGRLPHHRSPSRCRRLLAIRWLHRGKLGDGRRVVDLLRRRIVPDATSTATGRRTVVSDWGDGRHDPAGRSRRAWPAVHARRDESSLRLRGGRRLSRRVSRFTSDTRIRPSVNRIRVARSWRTHLYRSTPSGPTSINGGNRKFCFRRYSGLISRPAKSGIVDGRFSRPASTSATL